MSHLVSGAVVARIRLKKFTLYAAVIYARPITLVVSCHERQVTSSCSWTIVLHRKQIVADVGSGATLWLAGWHRADRNAWSKIDGSANSGVVQCMPRNK